MKVFNIETYVCRVGENARDNWGLLDESKGNYIFFDLVKKATTCLYLCVPFFGEIP